MDKLWNLFALIFSTDQGYPYTKQLLPDVNRHSDDRSEHFLTDFKTYPHSQKELFVSNLYAIRDRIENKPRNFSHGKDFSK
jgi:hypothetical protein